MHCALLCSGRSRSRSRSRSRTEKRPGRREGGGGGCRYRTHGYVNADTTRETLDGLGSDADGSCGVRRAPGRKEVLSVQCSVRYRPVGERGHRSPSPTTGLSTRVDRQTDGRTDTDKKGRWCANIAVLSLFMALLAYRYGRPCDTIEKGRQRASARAAAGAKGSREVGRARLGAAVRVSAPCAGWDGDGFAACGIRCVVFGEYSALGQRLWDPGSLLLRAVWAVRSMQCGRSRTSSAAAYRLERAARARSRLAEDGTPDCAKKRVLSAKFSTCSARSDADAWN